MKEILEKLKRSIQENLLFTSVWVVALVTVLTVNITTKSSYTFVGVTDSKEVNINTKHPVVVKTINVISGQGVKEGQLLAELERPDLIKQINAVSSELEELINEYELNETLNKNLKSIKRRRAQRENALTIRIKKLKNELSILKQEQTELFIYASFDGHIGSVNFKNGENASPFTPIMTMHKKTPTFVRGYIHESISHEINVNSIVKISTQNQSGSIKAIVTSVGTRIVDFPERFQRPGAEKVWGREVMIKLPDTNDFLLGEKVFMEVIEQGKKPDRSLANLYSEQIQSNLVKIVLPDSLKEFVDLEPSGSVFIEELNKYLLVSDDNNMDKPLVYTLERDGKISEHVIKIQGIDKIKDMEAMTKDEMGNIYISSSLSKPKKGKISKSRRLFLKLKFEAGKLLVETKVDLLELLNDAAKQNPQADWVKILKKDDYTDGDKYLIEMNVEGIAISNNKLYLGLRNEMITKYEIGILVIDDLSLMLNRNELKSDLVSIWSRMETPRDLDGKSKKEGISGIKIIKNKMYLTTAGNKKKNEGRLLQVNMNSRTIEKVLAEFEENRPEAISYNSIQNKILVLFEDNKGKESFMAEFDI